MGMMANQVQTQYIFVLKSGLDDWDKPLLSESSDDEIPAQHTKFNKISGKKTSLISITEEDKQNEIEQEEEQPITVYPQQQNDDDENEENDVFVSDHVLTQSMVSLDTAIQQTRRRTHLGQLLTSGGDYDESSVSPQIMAYMIRLAIYENDYTKPDAVYHTNSTFKKYDCSQNINKKKEEKKEDGSENEIDSVMISTSMNEQQSNASSISSSTSSSNNSNGICSEYESIEDGTKIFPSNHAIKQQQRIPAHLKASDEELCLFLRNPPSPPIPFYPSEVSKTRKKRKKQKKKSEEDESVYFAAPNEKSEEVTV